MTEIISGTGGLEPEPGSMPDRRTKASSHPSASTCQPASRPVGALSPAWSVGIDLMVLLLTMGAASALVVFGVSATTLGSVAAFVVTILTLWRRIKR